jgi:hypothetical protein
VDGGFAPRSRLGSLAPDAVLLGGEHLVVTEVLVCELHESLLLGLEVYEATLVDLGLLSGLGYSGLDKAWIAVRRHSCSAAV